MHIVNSCNPINTAMSVTVFAEKEENTVSPTAALKRMLNFNVPPVKNSASEPVWKDLRNQLYESYYLNFISAISRSKLEDIASAALGANAVNQVTKVFDQYLNFITLEDDMFVLCNQNKELVSYHDSACPVSLETILVFATAADAVPPMGFVPEPSIEFLHSQGQLQEIFPQGETSFNSLKLPIVQTYEEFRRNMDYAICYSIKLTKSLEGTWTTPSVTKLDKKLRENLRDARNSLFTGDTIGAGQFSSLPELLEKKRLIDLHTNVATAVLEHIKDFHLNRVDMEVSTGHENSPAGARPKKKNKKSYDLTASDKFWQKHKGRWVLS
ncbi:UNVERIFIED_CONTAM: hypothetical protein FKN15_073409 [Acipenser sinensis]